MNKTTPEEVFRLAARHAGYIANGITQFTLKELAALIDEVRRVDAESVALPGSLVISALLAMDAEARKRGEMYPQTSDEQDADTKAVSRVIGSLEFYTTGNQVRNGWPGVKNWPALPTPPAPARAVIPEKGMRVCFVRFGRKDAVFPPEGISRNALTGAFEHGVSVYEALERDGQYQILLPRLDPSSIATLGDCYNVAQGLWGIENHPLYEVEGMQIGVGSDGEPLLRDCRIVRRIFTQAAPARASGESEVAATTPNANKTETVAQDINFDAEKHAQIIYALQRAESALRQQADALMENLDYSAEFPAEDADRMKEAIELVRDSRASAPPALDRELPRYDVGLNGTSYMGMFRVADGPYVRFTDIAPTAVNDLQRQLQGASAAFVKLQTCCMTHGIAIERGGDTAQWAINIIERQAAKIRILATDYHRDEFRSGLDG